MVKLRKMSIKNGKDILKMEKNYKELEDVLRTYMYKINAYGAAQHYYFKGEIPTKKLDNAISTYASNVDQNQIMALLDTTLTQNGKEGILFTTTGLYSKDTLSEKVTVDYKDIIDIFVGSCNEKGKYISKDYNRKLKITKNNGDICYIDHKSLNKLPLKEMLNKIVELSKNGLTGDVDKYIVMEDHDENTKYNYIRAIINFAAIKGEINSETINKVYSLMTRIKVEAACRKKIWKYISGQEYEKIENIIVEMDKSVCGSIKTVHLSLIKDIMWVIEKSPDKFSKKESEFINIICGEDIGTAEIEVLYEALQNDRKFLEGEISDKEYSKLMTNLGAKAAAVGVPIAAVYLSGSVVGLSAAGITSGLAALGLGGVLGLSSMMTGVGVVIIIGVAVNELIKKINNHSSKNKENKREWLIKEVIKNNQLTITALIEDMHHFNIELNDLIFDVNLNKQKIVKLSKMIRFLSDALVKADDAKNANQKREETLLLED